MEILKLISKNKYLMIIILVLLGISLIFFYKSLILLLFIAIGAFSLIHTIFTRNYVGFELCTLVTVITAIQHGAMTGIVVGIASITLGLIFGRNVDAGIIISIIGFIIIAVVASFSVLKK